MTAKETVLAALTGISLLASPVGAGGPVLIKDAAETAPVVRDRDNALPLILLGLAVAAVVLGNGSDACNGDEGEPTPEPC
jgi:hypothetical protein